MTDHDKCITRKEWDDKNQWMYTDIQRVIKELKESFTAKLEEEKKERRQGDNKVDNLIKEVTAMAVNQQWMNKAVMGLYALLTGLLSISVWDIFIR